MPEKTVHEAKRRVLDTLGCAIGSYNAFPIKAVRQMALQVNGPSTIIGTKHKSTIELASFVNTSMSRYLDFMDTYTHAGEYVHPEDAIASILAVAEAGKRTGRDVIASTVLAYEIACRFVDFATIRTRGWDHVIWITMASSLSTSKLMRIPPEQMANALSIAVANNIPLRQIRIGGLSMWKGLTVAYASMAGTFASDLASRGITGPHQIYEGEKGFFNQVTGKKGLSIKKFSKKNFRIHDVHIKKYPAEINSQSAIDAALQVRKKIRSINDIQKLVVYTYRSSYEIIADKSKWRPKNRETADHSLPYIVCAALLWGRITEDEFTMKKITDKRIKKMLDKTEVIHSAECDRDYYPGMPNIMEVVLKNKTKIRSKVIHYKGSSRNPMSDQELEEKFRDLAKKFLTKKQTDNAVKIVWNLEKEKSVTRLLAHFAVKR
jgi:2-methylcitrate dehydratase